MVLGLLVEVDAEVMAGDIAGGLLVVAIKVLLLIDPASFNAEVLVLIGTPFPALQS